MATIRFLILLILATRDWTTRKGKGEAVIGVCILKLVSLFWCINIRVRHSGYWSDTVLRLYDVTIGGLCWENGLYLERMQSVTPHVLFYKILMVSSDNSVLLDD